MTNDPTRDDMLAFIATLPYPEERDDFDIEGAIYWFCADYHSGQDSNMYSALSMSQFRPGPLTSGPEPESTESDLYWELEHHYFPEIVAANEEAARLESEDEEES